jgi:hypothetical protein
VREAQQAGWRSSARVALMLLLLFFNQLNGAEFPRAVLLCCSVVVVVVVVVSPQSSSTRGYLESRYASVALSLNFKRVVTHVGSFDLENNSKMPVALLLLLLLLLSLLYLCAYV